MNIPLYKKIILLFTTITIVGCSSGDLKLIKVTETKYGDNHKDDNVTTTNYTYSDNGLLKSEVHKLPTSEYKTEYTYNPNGKLEKSGGTTYTYKGDLIVKGVNSDGNYYFVYSYNHKNQMVEKKLYDKDNDLFSQSTYGYDSNGNVVKTTFEDGSPHYTTYDTQKNPYSLVYDNAYLKIYGEGKNNLISDEDYTYEYIYNDKGYPTEKTIKKNGHIIGKTVYLYKE